MIKSIKTLKWNATANFIGLGYATVIVIIVFPLYLQYLGAEAFGLVGFFMVFQAWMLLLDMGMSPMLSRQASYARGQSMAFLELKRLVRSLEIIVFFIMLIVTLSITTGSEWIANNWLNVTSLDSKEVVICIILMGVMIGLHFFVSLYRSGIQGMESQVWLNVADILLVTLKYLGALLLLQFVTQDFVYFFVYQLFVSIIELLVLAIMFYHFIASTDKVGIRFFWNVLKPLLPFIGGIAYAAGIWVLLTQLDKVILSNVLPLTEYGYFTLVVVVAAGITKITSPISQAILPRMTFLLSQGREADMLMLYRKSTQLMAVIMFPLTGIIALFSTELLFAWTGDREAAEWAGPILSWFALGNGILAISAFQYYLQFAHGNVRMHVIYNTVSACIQIPVIIYVAFEYGAYGVALTWFAIRLITFIIWTPIVHNKFAPHILWPWFLKDVLPIFMLTFVLLMLIGSINIRFETLDRLEIFVTLLGIGFMIFVVNALCSYESRNLIFSMLRRAEIK